MPFRCGNPTESVLINRRSLPEGEAEFISCVSSFSLASPFSRSRQRRSGLLGQHVAMCGYPGRPHLFHGGWHRSVLVVPTPPGDSSRDPAGPRTNGRPGRDRSGRGTDRAARRSCGTGPRRSRPADPTGRDGWPPAAAQAISLRRRLCSASLPSLCQPRPRLCSSPSERLTLPETGRDLGRARLRPSLFRVPARTEPRPPKGPDGLGCVRRSEQCL